MRHVVIISKLMSQQSAKRIGWRKVDERFPSQSQLLAEFGFNLTVQECGVSDCVDCIAGDNRNLIHTWNL